MCIEGVPPNQALDDFSSIMMDIKKAKTEIEKEHYNAALSILESLARRGDSDAQFLLGYLFFTGADVNKSECLAWLKKAADQNNPEAYYYLAHCSDLYDFGPPQDNQQLECLYKAAQLGSTEAQRDLGCYYAIGEYGIQKDEVESKRWYTLAAKKGHADAQYNLGIMWLNGEGGPIDIEKAIYWLSLSTSKSIWDPMSVQAAELLADLYELGLDGINKDIKKSQYWRNRAKEIENSPRRSHPEWFYK